MRYLNKIVFINSAHIRYAEVAMDGNVHFTGTQGVGKTTLLRAILFFYNCRKDKLGIRIQGQKGFDDFYIPDSSSYIIYEVAGGKEESPFSIILFRHHNRAAFRFVDAPYDRNWFVDSPGTVVTDRSILLQRIRNSGIDVSKVIERRNEYLDILYGNSSAHLGKDLLKYHLLRSRQYRDIPRIIQNVFLNERVDAGFIKNIIINSISGEDEEIAVDLNFFRSKLTHFSDELRDISLWTDKNRQGIVETRRDADKIISTSRDIKAAQFSMREQCGMLVYAMNKAERDIPMLRAKIAKGDEAVKTLNDKLLKLTDGYNQDRRKIDDRIAILSSDLKRASDLRKEYIRIGIEDMIDRASKLEGLKLQLKQKERILTQLTSRHQSISDKYTMLRDRLNLDKDQFLQNLREKRNDLTSDFNERETQRMKKRSKLESETHDRFKTRIAGVDENLISLRELLTDRKEQRARTIASSPRKDDLDAVRQKISELENKIHRNSKAILKEENQLDTLRNTLELNCRQIETETEIKIKVLEGNLRQLELRKKEETLLLDRAKGSLCEWLEKNVEGWEKSIGKVFDEKSVLYSQDLNPQLTDDDAAGFFGISLDLDSIERDVRTPSMIREAIGALDSEIRSLTNTIIELREDSQRQIEESGNVIKNRMKAVQAEIDNLNRKIQTDSALSKDEALRLDTIESDEKIYLEELTAAFDRDIQETQSQIDNLTQERNSIDGKCESEIRRIRKMFSDEEKTDIIRRDASIRSFEEDAAKYAEEHDLRLKQMKKDEEAELSESGADIHMLDSTKREMDRISALIGRIEAERDKITEYRQHCRELLDHVPQMQAERKKSEDDADRLQRKYEERRQRYEMNLQEEERTLASLRLSCSRVVESKQRAEDFSHSSACPPDLKEACPIPTDLDCVAIISSLHRLMVDTHRLSDRLKEETNEFRKRFSANNTFKFPNRFDSLEDYHRYAESLEDFVSNDKIREFQQLTSNLYRDILSRAASDFNFLLGRESEIIRLVNAINRDFEKKTFAGVIRRIELRLDRSTMPIITQLQNIYDFWEEHQYELGEVNLFSSDEHADVNRESVKYLKSLAAALQNGSELNKLPLEQTFALKFRIQENDNMTDWVENIRAVGSEGTDILVKAIINILLISVFKNRAGQGGDFRLHCMMDEIGRLADENIQGILNFANERGIFIVNSSPKAHRPLSYRRLYVLSKDNEANTKIEPILSTREASLL